MTILLLAFAMPGCSGPSDEQSVDSEESDSKPIVYAVNYPLAYFAERIGGDLVDVVFPTPGGQDPADWVPGDTVIAEFQSADLILLNGAAYARWTTGATLPSSRTVITTRDVTDKYIEIRGAVTHKHGPDAEHSHAGLASETWLDPRLAVAQALVIKQELEKLAPDSATEFQVNFDSLRTDLESLDSQLESLFAEAPKAWIASHGVYDYLARRYALELESLHWEPNETPPDDQWSELERRLKQRPSSLMLWEDDPIATTASRLQALGVTVVTYRQLANRPSSGDYVSGMRENIETVKNAVAK